MLDKVIDMITLLVSILIDMIDMRIDSGVEADEFAFLLEQRYEACRITEKLEELKNE